MCIGEEKTVPVFLLDFLFQDLGILRRINLNKNWSLKLSQKAIEYMI